MFGRYLRIQRGNRAAPARWPNRGTWKLPLPLQASLSSGASSDKSIGTTPVPMTTPTRSGFSCSVSRPLSATARAAAPTPNWVARPMILRNLRCSPGRNGATSKSGTSAAIRTGCPDASKLRMGPTPLRPLTQADQKGALPTPLGATTPSPVTTTLRMAAFASRSCWLRNLVEDGLRLFESVTVTVASQPGHNRNRAPGWARLLKTEHKKPPSG